MSTAKKPTVRLTNPRKRKRHIFKGDLLGRFKKPDLQRRAHVCALLAMHLNSGRSIVESFADVADTMAEEDFDLALTLDEIHAQIEQGRELYEVLPPFESRLGLQFVALASVGAKVGQTAETFAKLNLIFTNDFKTRNSVFTQFRPLIVLFAGSAAVLYSLLKYAVPAYRMIYEAMAPGADLPWETEYLLAASDFVSGTAGTITLVTIALLAIATVVATKRSQKALYRFDRACLMVPKLGQILLYRSVARAVQHMSASVDVVNAPESLQLAGKAAPNRYVAEAFFLAAPLAHHQPHWVALQSTGRLPPTVIGAIRTAFEAGALDKLSETIVPLWNERVEYETRKLVDKIDPWTKLLGGILVLYLMIAMYMPIWELAAKSGDSHHAATTAAIGK